MRAGRRANDATSDVRRERSGVSGVATFECTAGAGVPNKPVLPTATTPPANNPLRPLRRQTGRPLGSGATVGRLRAIGYEQRAEGD